jgi:hypothetical protein
MEEGYDVEEFLGFLRNAKFEGENIENWNIAELK